MFDLVAVLVLPVLTILTDTGVDPNFAFNAFLVGAIGTLGAFVGYTIRDTIQDARKQRDLAMEGWRGQTAATDKLADALSQRNALDEQRLKDSK